jgi:hypothetical protein
VTSKVEVLVKKPILYTVSSPLLIADKTRTALGQSYNDGTIIVQAGTQKKKWNGTGWSETIIPPVGTYRQGSMMSTVQLPDGTMMAFDYTYTKRIKFSTTTLTWKGAYLKYASPLGEKIGEGEITIDKLPKDSDLENYQVNGLYRTDKYIYMPIQRLILGKDELWQRADGKLHNGYGRRGETYMVRSEVTDPTNFKFRGAIGLKEHYVDLLKRSNLKFDLPLYYASAAQCVGLSDENITCATRGSADDDDGFYRPVDPTKIFNTPTSVQTPNSFDSNKIAPGIYAPALEPNMFYAPKNTTAIPPSMLSISNDGGVTWTRKLISGQGGIGNAFAYDAENDLLVIVRGGFTYPRKYIIAQYSRDKGQTWSGQIKISSGYTTGTAYIAKTGPKKFEIVYDSLDYYIQYDKTAKASINDGYRMYTRTLTVN